MNRAKIQDYIDQRVEERKGAFHSQMVDRRHFLINNHSYEIINDEHDSFDLERFTDRFSMIMSKFDYIVGDWGYDQLRLRGFYATSNPLFTPDRGVDTIQDYLYEQCNFGCDFFVLHNEEVNIPRHTRGKRSRNRRRRHPEFKEKRMKLKEPTVRKRHHQEVKSVRKNNQRHFVIKRGAVNNEGLHDLLY